MKKYASLTFLLLFTFTLTACTDTTMLVDETPPLLEVCDEMGNRYPDAAAAREAGLTEAQFGATYCREYKMHPSWDKDNDGLNDCENDGTCDHTVDYSQPRIESSGDYVGLSIEEAQKLAADSGVPFRVVMEDGQPLPVTMDYRPGRINAVVESGKVVGYQVEGAEEMEEPVEGYDAESWKTLIPESCMAYFDGCNNCRRAPGSDVGACTRMACQKYEQPRCLDEDDMAEQ